MKNVFLFLFLAIVSYSFSQDKKEQNLLYAFKINAKQMERKSNLNQTESTQDFIRGVSRAFADISDDVADMPRPLEDALRTPSAYGISYDTYKYYGLEKAGLLSSVMVADLVDYEVFKEGLSADDLKAVFLEKDGLIEVYPNSVFTDKKKLIIVSTDNITYQGYDAPRLVNNKEDALDTKYMKCTEEEYARQVAVPVEERSFEGYRSYGFCGDWYEGENIYYNNADKEISTGSLEKKKSSGNVNSMEGKIEAAEEAVETVIESTDEQEAEIIYLEGGEVEEARDASDYYSSGDKEGYYIEYYRPYILLDNKNVALQFVNGTEFSKSVSYLRYKTSKADQAFWLNNESLVGVYQEAIAEEFSGLSYGVMTNTINKMGFLKGSALLGELFFNNGKAELTAYNYGNKELLSRAKKLYSARLDKKLVKYLPASTPVYFAGALNMEEFYAQYDEYVTPILSSIPEYDTIAVQSYELLKMALDKDALTKLFTGQTLTFTDGSYDFEKYYTDYSYDEDYNYVKKDTMKIEKRPSVFSFMGTQDKDSWLRVAQMLEQSGYVKKEGNVYKVYDKSRKFSSYGKEPREVGFYFAVTEEAVVLSSDKVGLSKIVSGKFSGPSKDQKKNLKKYNTYMNLDFEKGSDYLLRSGWIEGTELLRLLSEMKQYKNLEIKGVEYGAGYVSASMVVDAKNESVNILEQVFNSIQVISGE